MLNHTFRNALLVAQMLGIFYAWIDCLSIIEVGDDYADWKKESPIMYKVYCNAEFKLYASENNQS